MSTTTANLGLFKYDTTNPTDLASAFNINTALNNNWDKIDEAVSNSSGARNIGEIVASTIPLTDAGLHLLDGALISGSGSYGDFIEFIGNLYTNLYYDNCFCLESDWQTAITTYGVCGKFVYNADWYAWKTADNSSDTVYYTNAIPNTPVGISQQPSLDLYYTDDITYFPANKKLQSANMRPGNNGTLTSDNVHFYKRYAEGDLNSTVRLPKYSNKIYTQELNATAPVVGNGMSLGLTNGTVNAGLSHNTASPYHLGGAPTGYGASVGANAPTTNALGSQTAVGITSDASYSGIIAQLSNITTALDGYYYIVVATTTKTDIEVDIDEIATDLNGKADVDLSNVPTSKGILTESYTNDKSGYRIYSDGWCIQWGVNSNNTTNINIQITLLKNYANVNYGVIMARENQTANNITNSQFCANNKTTSSFYMQSGYNGNNTGNASTVLWFTFGYIN